MKINLTFLLIGFTISAFSQKSQIKGRVVGEHMESVLAAQIKNLKTQQEAQADADGFYYINAAVGDTLSFKYIGYTPEKRVVTNSSKNLNVLLINKSVNDLGANWTKRQSKKAKKDMEKYYRQLESKVKRSGKWNYAWLMGVNGPIGINK